VASAHECCQAALCNSQKRQCIGLLRWLGLDRHLSLGLLVIPNSKRLRALDDLYLMAAEKPMEFAEYRKATSFFAVFTAIRYRN
jgi:hypothetical protein